ncbi:MAG TPA: DRTGG domain-containing protein [Bacillota bacterium]|nr:DRTGG domain-containing protein [Bacillota bacterium]HOR85699.1 DRTGG domain-containing protein [Bacillota bacterium]HPL54319.1 DRTGG domain-containing protein [Bacillota bacterium]
MKIYEVKEILGAEVLCGDNLMENEVSYAFGSDLMSDVLAFVKGKTLLLTGLTNQQVVRTAEIADLSAIVFVRGKKPGDDIVELAVEKGIALLLTRNTMYTASGKLYSRGLEGVSID